MKTLIYTLDEKTGKIEKRASYSIEPKRALICYIMQQEKNFNTWAYPDHIQGIRESDREPNHFYYDDIKNCQVIAAYPA